MSRSAPPDPRFLGVDLHKHYLVIGGVNARQDVVLQPRRLELEDWPTWAAQHLLPSDVLVVEATGNTWSFYDGVVERVARVEVAHAGKIALIAHTRVKTDKHDVMKLARLSAANLIPCVWVPPQPVRTLRLLFSHRRRLVKSTTHVKNRLQSLLHRHQLTPPPGNPFGQSQRAWWLALAVSPTEQLHVRHDLASLQLGEDQIAEVESELHRLALAEPWAQPVTFLVQLPGFSPLTALAVLAAIGEISRFETAKQLVGYAGLGASVHDSGLTYRTGGITKSGRRDLRYALVEAARSAARYHSHWQAVFATLTRRMPENKAVVAIARRLLVSIWHILSKRVPDLHAEPERVATKFMRWSWALTPEQRQGLSTRQFIRLKLMSLKMGSDLTHLTYGKMPRRIATTEELLKERPDLRPPG